MKSIHRESQLLPASSREANLSPCLARQDHAVPGLLILTVEADACRTNCKEWTESKQLFCYDSQVCKTTPKWQHHGLPTLSSSASVTVCHFSNSSYIAGRAIYIAIYVASIIGRGVALKPWTHPGCNYPSEAAETPLQAAILPRKEPVRIMSFGLSMQEHRRQQVRQGRQLID